MSYETQDGKTAEIRRISWEAFKACAERADGRRPRVRTVQYSEDETRPWDEVVEVAQSWVGHKGLMVLQPRGYDPLNWNCEYVTAYPELKIFSVIPAITEWYPSHSQNLQSITGGQDSNPQNTRRT